MTYRYRPEILRLLAMHGVIPKPTTPPERARAVVNDIYRYELRLLRDRYLVGEFSKQEYYDQVVEVRQVQPAVVGEAEPAQGGAGALGEDPMESNSHEKFWYTTEPLASGI